MTSLSIKYTTCVTCRASAVTTANEYVASEDILQATNLVMYGWCKGNDELNRGNLEIEAETPRN